MDKEFKRAELAFQNLKNRLREKEISREEFIDEIKKLRLKDEEGRFWMIGVKTGKWYYFNGAEWIPSEPPPVQEKKAICIYCGFENRLEAEVCARCGGEVGEGAPDSREIKGDSRAFENLLEEDHFELHMASLHAVSQLLFWGTFGALAGIFLGVFWGVTEYLSGLDFLVPSFLKEFQGRLVGGFLFAGFGGVCGFLLLAVFGLVLALVFNFISSLTGGIKVRFMRTKTKKPESE